MNFIRLFKPLRLLIFVFLLQIPFVTSIEVQMARAEASDGIIAQDVEWQEVEPIYGLSGMLKNESKPIRLMLNKSEGIDVVGKTSEIGYQLETIAAEDSIQVWGVLYQNTEGAQQIVIADILNLDSSIAPELPTSKMMLIYGKTILTVLFAVLLASGLSWLVGLPFKEAKNQKSEEEDEGDKKGVSRGWKARLAFLLPWTVWGLTLWVLFVTLNVNISSIGQIFIAGGLAIGLILTPAGSNIVAGILNAWNDVFREDEVIGVGNDVGKVMRRGLLSTRVKTTDGSFYDFPNRRLLEDVVQNFTRVKGFRIDVVIAVDEFELNRDKYRQIKEILEKVIADEAWSYGGNEGFVLADEIAPNSFNYRVFAWIDSRWNMVRCQGELLEKCILALDKAGISIGQTSFIASRRLVVTNSWASKSPQKDQGSPSLQNGFQNDVSKLGAKVGA